MVKKVWQTDRQTDGRTDGQTDWTSHIAAWSQLKTLANRQARMWQEMEHDTDKCAVQINNTETRTSPKAHHHWHCRRLSIWQPPVHPATDTSQMTTVRLLNIIPVRRLQMVCAVTLNTRWWPLCEAGSYIFLWRPNQCPLSSSSCWNNENLVYLTCSIQISIRNDTVSEQ